MTEISHVPSPFSSEPFSQWSDLHSRLYRERIIFLSQPIDDAVANQVIALMLYLDAEDADRDIRLYINSPGGSISAGLAIYDTMQCIRSDIITGCVGTVASVGSLLLATGTHSKRVASRHARIMLQSPSSAIPQSSALDIEIAAREIAYQRDRLNELYARCTGQSVEKIAADTQRDVFLSAQEALAYGLIDRCL